MTITDILKQGLNISFENINEKRLGRHKSIVGISVTISRREDTECFFSEEVSNENWDKYKKDILKSCYLRFMEMHKRIGDIEL